MTEHSRSVDGIRETLASLDARMDRRFERLEHRVEAIDMKADRGFHALNTKLDAKFEGVNGDMRKQFMWVVGIQITMAAAIVAALVSVAK